MNTMLRASGFLLLACAAIACGPVDDSPEPPPPGTVIIELGSAMDALSGDGGFRAVSDGTELPLRQGSQGGLHVYINIKIPTDTVGQTSDFPAIYREARRVSDGELVSRLRHKTKLVASSTSAYETEQSLSLFLCPTPVGIGIGEELLELTIDVMPDYDEEPIAQGKLRFTPVCADDSEEFCRRICFG